MIIHNVEQGSEEWHLARTGVITASRVKDARDRLKNGSYSAKALDYAMELAMERTTGYPLDEGFTTWQMKRGNELEDQGRSYFERSTGFNVEQVGFITSDCGNFGASPDGLVGTDAGLEIKCPVSASQIRKLFIDFDISDYHDQVQFGLWITGRTWWHLVTYHPGLEAQGIPLKQWTVIRDDEYIESMVKDLNEFNEMVYNKFMPAIAA